MSTDAIAVCRELPGPEYVLAALLEAGEHLRVLHDDRTGVVELLDDLGRTVLQMESPGWCRWRGRPAACSASTGRPSRAGGWSCTPHPARTAATR